MKTSRIKFPRRVRIHGGECGAVARALHHEAQKDALMSHEWLISRQADLGKASESTFNERKQMSTKTSFKRIALVVVSALGFGLVSATAPATAAPNTNFNCSTAFSSMTAIATTAVVGDGTNASVTTASAHGFTVGDIVTVAGVVNAGLNNATATVLTVPTTTTFTYANATNATAATQGTVKLNLPSRKCQGIAGAANYVTVSATALDVYVVLTGGTFSDGTTAKTITTVTGSANILTPTAGTITASGYPITAGVASATAQTVTITVLSAPSGTVYSSTSVVETLYDNNAGTNHTVYKYTSTATGAVTRIANAAASSSDELFSFALTQKDAAGATLADASTKAVTASLSGVGSLSMNGTSAQSQYVTAIATDPNNRVVHVYADGRAGKSTLTITVNGTVVKTYDFIFYGSVASYTFALEEAYLPALGTDGSATVIALDANGQAVPGKTVYFSSGTTTVATVGASSGVTTGDVDELITDPLVWAAFGSASVAVSGEAKGSSVITAANATSSATVTATATAVVTGAVASTVTWAFDKTSYEPGEKATITVTLKDSDGNPVGDDTYTLWGTVPSSNVNATLITGFGATATTVSGVAKYSYYMPLSAGTVTFTGKLASDVDLAAALQGTTQTLSTTVTGGAAAAAAEAATDAAAEAIDAANAATDAANLAAEAADAATVAAEEARDAADAATAAVEELATQVATLMAALKAQITTLANTVAKIAKKVKA